MTIGKFGRYLVFTAAAGRLLPRPVLPLGSHYVPLSIAMTTATYDELARHWTRLHRFGHVYSIASWDRAAMMPAKGNEARAEALAEMDALLHGLRTEPRLADLIARAEHEPLGDAERANLREIRRSWMRVERAAGVAGGGAVARDLALRARLATQRPADDWAGFLVNLRDVVRLAREEAKHLADATGLAPYDALMDQYEPGMTSVEVERVFDDLQSWLPGLVRAVRERQASEPVVAPRGPFPKAAQRALSLEVMALLGFDFEAGRLDESAHPFSGGVPEDTRLTTRYREDDFMQSLMGTIHETGHARYEQNLPRDWLGQPVARARSMAIHESQSLSFEMQLGRSAGFVGLIAPLLGKHLGAQPAFEVANLQRLLTRVEPGLIRVDADELTYPAHVILRFGIERALIDGEIEAEDIPALWDEGMASLLGLDTRGNFRDGCMQDVHWSAGLSATSRATRSARCTRRSGSRRSVAARPISTRASPAATWRRCSIGCATTSGCRPAAGPTAELATRASGETLNPIHFRRHLESRYLGQATV